MSSDPFDIFNDSSKYYRGPYFSNYAEHPDRLSRDSFWVALAIVGLIFLVLLICLIIASRDVVSSQNVDESNEN